VGAAVVEGGEWMRAGGLFFLSTTAAAAINHKSFSIQNRNRLVRGPQRGSGKQAAELDARRRSRERGGDSATPHTGRQRRRNTALGPAGGLVLAKGLRVLQLYEADSCGVTVRQL
jgi:hypothetical protein